MKRFALGLLAASAAALIGTGCAHTQTVVLRQVGPAPITQQKEENMASANQGSLVVYSAWQKTGTDDPEHDHHSSYDILKGDAVLRHVRNYFNPMLEEPIEVPLPAGNYQVRARAQGYGYVSVPVVIAAGRTTKVYLDGSGREELAQAPVAEQVRLPDGRVVGWAQ
jgi:hypothetical protein